MRVREPFNTYSHLTGGILAAIATIVLCVMARQNALAVVAFAIFGAGAIFLYSGSTAYHWASTSKSWLQRMDHSAIFVMIAASYTPLCLLTLDAPTKWIVLGTQWGLAIAGLLYNMLKGKPPAWVRLTMYLTMGWMALPLTPLILKYSNPTVLAWMIAGGLAYTIGVFFYSSKKPLLWPGKFSNHEIWHLFVLAGSACHFTMMWWLPLGG